MMSDISKLAPGVIACAAIAVPSWYLGKTIDVVGGPVFAILIGMSAALFWRDKGSARPGIAFVSKKILQLAVILLGFGMNLGSVFKVGAQSLPIIVSTISAALIVAYVLSRAMGMDRSVSTLIGVGSSICGGSAIAATAPVINASDDEIAQSISVIFLFNVAAALIFPTLGGVLGMSDQGFALFAGTAVNDTSSVTAAASAWDGIHGSSILGVSATVKMTRTLAIIPITVVLALVRGSKSGGSVSLAKIFPWFVALFLAASVVTTFVPLPSELVLFLKNASKFFIVTAMAAIGLNTDLIKLIKSGAKPIALGFCTWAAIALVSLFAQKMAGLW